MTSTRAEGYLQHKYMQRYNSIGLAAILGWRGPCRDLLDGVFPDDFVAACKLKPLNKRWVVCIDYGAHHEEDAPRRLELMHSGRVSVRWALRLRAALNRLYPIYLGWRGDVTTEPPKTCQNDEHAAWHEHRTDPAFIPDDGFWRCVACGWLLDSDGTRIRERYSPIDRSPRGVYKKGSGYGD